MSTDWPVAPPILNVICVTATSLTIDGAQVLASCFESQSREYVFAAPIAMMAPVWEARAWRDDDTKLRYFRCRHGLLEAITLLDVVVNP